MKVIVFVITIFALSNVTRAIPAPADKDAIIFIDEVKENNKDSIITPPVLPVIEHLERDPTTLRKEDNEVIPQTKSARANEVSPRFGFNTGFGVAPTSNGGFSTSFSHGFSGAGGHSQSGSHSINVGGLPQGGFQVSQSSSQSSSFGSNHGLLGASLSGSQSNSQSSSFSAGLHGIQSASSGASAGSTSGNIFGHGFSSSNAQSQSAANSLGINGLSSAFGQGANQAGSFPGHSFSNGQSSSGAFGNGAVAQGSGFGFAQNGNGFTGSGAGSQSSAAVFQGTNRLPIPNRPPSGRPNSFNPNIDIRGQRGFGSPIVFPGPTNIKRLPNLRSVPTGLVPPNQVRNQQFRAVRRKPSTYQVIRIEV